MSEQSTYRLTQQRFAFPHVSRAHPLRPLLWPTLSFFFSTRPHPSSSSAPTFNGTV